VVLIEVAKRNGLRVGFWATPEIPEAREAVWRELLAAEVDYVKTDHLAELETFLLQNDPQPTEPHVYWTGSTG
jgi:glycerophosphoryl diester phosphodiesterase family protein